MTAQAMKQKNQAVCDSAIETLGQKIDALKSVKVGDSFNEKPERRRIDKELRLCQRLIDIFSETIKQIDQL